MKSTTGQSSGNVPKTARDAAPAHHRKAAAATSRTMKQANGHTVKRGSKRTEAFISAMMGIRLK